MTSVFGFEFTVQEDSGIEQRVKAIPSLLEVEPLITTLIIKVRR